MKIEMEETAANSLPYEATPMRLDSPEACSRQMAACAALGDLDCASEIFEEDATFVHEDGTVVRGLAAIRETLAEFIRARPDLKITVRRSVQAGGDLAILYLDWSYESVESNGAPVPNAGASVQIARRQHDGTWRVVFDDHGHGIP